LIVSSCSSATGGLSGLGDVSKDAANLAALANTQASQNATETVDESSIATESGSSSEMAMLMADSRGLNSGINASITVTHSDSAFSTGGKSQETFADDIVTVERKWTNAEGSSVDDIVTRPEIPESGWNVPSTSLSSTVGFQYMSPPDGNKLSTTIYYSDGSGYLRVLDYVGTSGTVKREVYAWGLTGSTLPSFGSAASPILVGPALPSNYDIIYRSGPLASISAPTDAIYSSYPTLLTSAPLRMVTSRSAPRTVDW
jgi:hypothetical protein